MLKLVMVKTTNSDGSQVKNLILSNENFEKEVSIISGAAQTYVCVVVAYLDLRNVDFESLLSYSKMFSKQYNLPVSFKFKGRSFRIPVDSGIKNYNSEILGLEKFSQKIFCY